MAKIVPFESDYASHPSYQEALSEIISELGQLKEQVISLSIGLATSGKWREWSDKKEEGEVFDFTEKMLRDTGDPNVELINNLVDTIISTQEKLKNGLIKRS